MTVAPIVHGGGISAAAARYGGRPEDWLDLSTGINPQPVAVPEIPLAAWHCLPDRHLTDAARRAAADFYYSGDILPLPVPGTQSAIQLLPRLVPPGKRVAILSPTYGEYARAFMFAGLPVDAIAAIDEIRPEHGLVVIVNPNNPDGRVVARDSLLDVARRLSAQGGRLLVDEAFADCTPDVSIAGDISSVPGLIVFRSFGKFFGLAGLRLGFVIADNETLRQFEEWLGPWAVSGPALFVAETCLRADPQPVRAEIAARKFMQMQALEAAALTIVGGTPLFSLVSHPRAEALHEHLCRQRILVRKFDYRPDWLRFGLPPDRQGGHRLLEALAGWSGR